MKKVIPLIKSFKAVFYFQFFKLREIAFGAIQIRCSIEIKFQILILGRTHLLALSLSLPPGPTCQPVPLVNTLTFLSLCPVKSLLLPPHDPSPPRPCRYLTEPRAAPLPSKPCSTLLPTPFISNRAHHRANLPPSRHLLSPPSKRPCRALFLHRSYRTAVHLVSILSCSGSSTTRAFTIPAVLPELGSRPPPSFKP
jgi:hypothetical protein